MKNTGFEYEVLVQAIFQEINNQESAKNITVERDVKLNGKSGIKHQIDVFWEFEIGGIIYSTIVQAKDWTCSVKQEQILALKSVLDDLPKQPRGIIVTKKGFQKGARKFAENHGIELFELKEIPKPPPVQMTLGSFVQVGLNLEEQCSETVIYPTEYFNIKYILKKSWIKRKSKNLGQESVSESLKTPPDWNQNLYNSSFQQIETIWEVIGEFLEPIQDEAELALENTLVYCKSLCYKFNFPTFFPTKSKFLPFVRIEGISFDIEITKGELIKAPFTKPGITTFILKNIIDGKEKKFDVKKKEIT